MRLAPALKPSAVAARRLTVVASDVAPIGGMERVAYELARRLLDRGWDLTVIARTCALAVGPRLRFVRLPSPSRPVSAALFCDLALGSLALRRHRRGLVHTHNPMLANRVDVITVHFCERAYRERVGVSRASRASALYRLNSWGATRLHLVLERWCFRPKRTRALTCVSKGVLQEIGAFYPAMAGRTEVVGNGVDLARFAPDLAERARVRGELGINESDLLALFVGGDWERKNLRVAVDGVAAADGWRLAVVGAGDRQRFARIAAEQEAADRVHFVGPVNDAAPYFRAADAFVFPSAYETFSLAAHEAAAAGLPLVVSRVHGVEELVEEGINGCLVAPRAEVIARRLGELRDVPRLRATMRAASRAAAERYAWDRVVDAYEELYNRLESDRAS
jgi:glycosyltransferase involved in cell wall biosynthesis